ncbi:histidine kinase N-terminal 7TM domain-containing protein [Spongisporangium articulatum]|uniref:Histidine kinase N-terminal 7TM domain-containing protein n=1 Tax=Spongisporangium articulatum TaxID=3362603 RepID=A0ABW8AH65_9ACTN
MSWHAAAVLGFMALSVLYLTLATFVWQHRDVVGSRPLIAMLVAVKLWSLFYALELSSRTEQATSLWAGLKFIGIVTLPPALWSFVRQWTGHPPLRRRTLALLCVEPVTVLTLLALPQTHDLIHVYEGQTLFGAPYPSSGGPVFWFHAVYTYVVMFSAVIALTVAMFRVARPYRRQAMVLVAASVLPMVANFLWNAELGDRPTVDPTPALFAITGVVLVWGFFRLQLLDVVPVARGVVVEQMADAVMVLDAYGRIADANPACSRLLGTPRAALVGRRAVDYLPGLAPALADAEREPDLQVELSVDAALLDARLPQLPEPVPTPRRARTRRQERGTTTTTPPTGTAAVGAAPETRELSASLSTVTDTLGREVACTVVLRDVTERKRIERRLRVLLAEQTRLSGVLRQSLMPASLPEVAGLRLAARYRPAPGGEVSGDFYDVHPTDDGRWAFVLGDVSGKGPHAAVVTSTARHTVRTLSAQGWGPRDVLEQLNRALVSAEDPERFCTAVYGQVDPPTVTGNVRVHLALGGHPPPLVRRPDGSVTSVGRPGTVLGMQTRVRLDEVTLDLAVGDLLLAYTDGVTETRSGDALFGEDRLACALAEAAGDGTATLADAAVESVLGSLARFGPARDDVALLALVVSG